MRLCAPTYRNSSHRVLTLFYSVFFRNHGCANAKRYVPGKLSTRSNTTVFSSGTILVLQKNGLPVCGNLRVVQHPCAGAGRRAQLRYVCLLAVFTCSRAPAAAPGGRVRRIRPPC